MKKRLLFFALLIALTVNTACSDNNPSSEKTTDGTQHTQSTETTAESDGKIPYDVSGLDYGGYTFKTVSFDNETVNLWSGIPNDIYSEQEDGDVLNDSVYKRNITVENALNIHIVNELLDDGTISRRIEQSVLSGSNDVDAAFPRMYLLPQLVQKELLYDLNTIQGLDLTQPWYDRNAVEAMTINGKLFSVCSDITFTDKLSTYVTFYNQKMAADYDLGDLYAYVEKDQWTLDLLLELSENASQDLDNNGVYNEKDAYGLSCQNDGVYILLNAGNLCICDTNSEGDVVFSLTESKTMDALQKIYELMTDQRRYFNRQTFNLTLNDAINMFNENRALFLVRPLQSLFVMRSMQSDFGILPMPKLEEGQASYGSAVNPYSATLLCLPFYQEDAERTGEIIQYLAYESYYTVSEPFYESVLGTKLIRDDSSAHMLDIAFANRVYDTGLIWNFGDINTKLLTYRQTDVASLLESVESKVNKAIDQLNELLS